ncbi:uncharacterized protein LOC108116743 [Drosophila eugracilis]|uniref:uncharacterized protein LOC108116743 n=1 Tax=Drosophila eugracilis TaxID=29029 RepID=UPI0007E5DAB4|nr:uncharacterized protein LOC108116743 [Drosophila eugracilis]
MSLAWIILLGLLISERGTFVSLATTSPPYRLRSTHLPAIKSPGVEHRTTQRVLQITRPRKVALKTDRTQNVEDFNETISKSEWTEYNVWQVLKADGKTNLYILFFTIYISYLVYVLF